jgi:hypothetical protein
MTGAVRPAKPDGHTAVTEDHLGTVAGKAGPRICRLHWEGTFSRRHDQPLVRNEVDYLVGVERVRPQKRPTKSRRVPVASGLPVCQATRSIFACRGWRVVSVADIGSHLVTWSGDVDHGRHADGLHGSTVSVQTEVSTRYDRSQGEIARWQSRDPHNFLVTAAGPAIL